MGETIVYGDGIQRADVLRDMATEYQWVDITDKINLTSFDTYQFNLLPGKSLFNELKDGAGLRFTQYTGTGLYNYGVATYGLGSPHYITFSGLALPNTSSPLTGVWYSNYTTQMTLTVRGKYGNDQEWDLLKTDEKIEVRWQGGPCFIVRANIQQNIQDSIDDAYVNVMTDYGDGLYRLFANSQQPSPAGGIIQFNSANLSPSRYGIGYGDKITLACETPGNVGDAEDLSVTLKIVYR